MVRRLRGVSESVRARTLKGRQRAKCPSYDRRKAGFHGAHGAKSSRNATNGQDVWSYESGKGGTRCRCRAAAKLRGTRERCGAGKQKRCFGIGHRAKFVFKCDAAIA